MVGTGTFLANRYEIIEKIGSGGMADVYKAKDTVLNRFVAIKILKQQYSTDATFVKKFKVEAQSAAGLSHPNIVGVFDVGEERGVHYIVMELVQGITLKNYIEMKGKLDIREALNISVQIASGLNNAHTNRIIHRDIKPQNIIMSRDGKVKVTDFGIAKVADSTTVTTTAAGTVHYISPEQARGGYSDEKSDIYSLGITMYEMVTGRVPFEGETNVAVALLHIQGEMTPPRQLEPSIPVSFEKIILKCTQKKPDRRYANAKELIADLRKVLIHPDGEYVILPGFVPEGTTIVMGEEELSTIKEAEADGRTKKIDPVAVEAALAADTVSKKASKIADDDEEEEEDVNPALSRVMMILGITGFVILLIIIGFLVTNILGTFGKGSIINKKDSTETVTESLETEESVQTVTLEDLRGMTESQARSVLRGLGLVIEVEKGENSNYNEGEIYDQSPSAYEVVEVGSTVTVYINTGKDTTSLYDVSGMDYSQAKAKLENLGYNVLLEFEDSDDVDKDKVIRTSPEAGSQVAEGDTITIYASSGPENVNVTMPDLHGYSLSEAISIIQEYGLVFGGSYEDYSSTYAEGEVMLQSIIAGATIEKGTSIVVTVSLGPEETTTESHEEETEHQEETEEPSQTTYTGTVYISSPFGGEYTDEDGETHRISEGQVTVVVTQEDGTSQTIYDQYVTEGNLPSAIDVSSSSSSSGTVYVYLNGSVYDTSSVSFN